MLFLSIPAQCLYIVCTGFILSKNGKIVAAGDRVRNELRANILKALANVTRVCIIERLREGELNVTELSEKLGESSSITSRHLSILRNAGLIEHKKKGAKIVYSLTGDGITSILEAVDGVIKMNYEKYQTFFESKKQKTESVR